MDKGLRLLIGAIMFSPVLLIPVAGIFLGTFYLITGWEREPSDKQRFGAAHVAFVSRIETKVVGNSYYLKYQNSNDFVKVTKESFDLETERDNYYVNSTRYGCVLWICIITGFALLRGVNKSGIAVPTGEISVSVPGEGTWDVNQNTGEMTFVPNFGLEASSCPYERLRSKHRTKPSDTIET